MKIYCPSKYGLKVDQVVRPKQRSLPVLVKVECRNSKLLWIDPNGACHPLYKGVVHKNFDYNIELFTSALCNLLLEFFPGKEPMLLQQGAMQLLATLTTRPEPGLRLNGVWTLMNLAFRAEQNIDESFRFIKKFSITDAMMILHGPQVMQAVVLVLEGPHSPDVKGQALCILSNIVDGERAKDHIMANDNGVVHKNFDYNIELFALCNLLLEFFPGKELMLLQQGVMQLLATLTTRSEPGLRLNGVWALMNLAFRAEQNIDQSFRFIKKFSITDAMMILHGPQVMQAVVLVLEGPHSPDVKGQAPCILSNTVDGERAKDHITANDNVLNKLADYI
ncbi:hypothetical protein ILUMI_05923 [Ignelater luminosus]|uniref:Armadillo repeat-containing protein 8 n=1 Tax=Ignelater luminosus TaxID=2038154 RepID=A0A8K0DC43_IGNLU|nr:hypothetical protein ILUMI_05923 [Ignelater luminosus]